MAAITLCISWALHTDDRAALTFLASGHGAASVRSAGRVRLGTRGRAGEGGWGAGIQGSGKGGRGQGGREAGVREGRQRDVLTHSLTPPTELREAQADLSTSSILLNQQKKSSSEIKGKHKGKRYWSRSVVPRRVQQKRKS